MVQGDEAEDVIQEVAYVGGSQVVRVNHSHVEVHVGNWQLVGKVIQVGQGNKGNVLYIGENLQESD